MKMSFRKFRQYYMMPAIAVLLILCAVIYLVWGFFDREPGPVLYIAVFDAPMDTDEEQKLAGKMGIEGRVVFDDSFRSDQPRDAERLQVLIANHVADVVIGSREVIRTLAGFGYFRDLKAEAPPGVIPDGMLCCFPGYRDTDEISMDDNETGRGEEKAYAISLSESGEWKRLSDGRASDFYAGIVAEDINDENAFGFIGYICGGRNE